ncbi:MAG: hypothetical protein AAF990_28280, partial [Bacteroidota bacterium]
MKKTLLKIQFILGLNSKTFLSTKSAKWCFLLLTLLPLAASVQAQNNLTVDFQGASGVPDFINICGDPDTMTVEVSVAGPSPAPRRNIQATAHLFKGVRFEGLLTAASTPGINVSAVDPNNPVFIIPDLSPGGGLSTAVISFLVKADCEYVDTLTANDASVVFDTWEFRYQLGANNLTETDSNVEYRDAFAVPFFTVDVNNTHGPARVGECFDRDIEINNSGLDGFVDSVFYESIIGNGLYVSALQVNGVNQPFNKQAMPGGDTLITLVLDGAHFIGNTSISGPGDGDVFLDPDETVTITESICVLSCVEDRSSQYTAAWGCNGRNCNSASATDFIRIGEGSANAGFFPAGSVMEQDAGYCQTGLSVVTFSNDGAEADAGFGTMLNITSGIGMGSTISGTDSFALEDEGFRITSLRIAGVNIPSPRYLI